MGDVRGSNSMSQVPAWLWAGGTEPSGTEGASGPVGAAPPPLQAGARLDGQTDVGSPGSRNPGPQLAELAQQAAFEGDARFAGLDVGPSRVASSHLDERTTRLATEVQTQVLSEISERRQEIQTLSQDPQALRVHLGKIAASSVSTQVLARALEGLGVSEGVRMDTAITLQGLHLDHRRLAVFMSGEDVGLSPVVERLQRGFPTAIRALDRMEADLNRPGFELQELLHRPEFAASRERAVQSLVAAGERPQLRAQLRTIRAEARRSDLLGGAVIDQQVSLAEVSKSAKRAWDIGSIAINTLKDLNRVRHASDYVNHGFAERNLEDRAAATFVLNRVSEGAGLIHPAAGAAIDALRIAETFVH